MSRTDSVSLDAPSVEPPVVKRSKFHNIKLLVSLFVMFMVVVSDVFANSVISCFGSKAMKGRSPTSWGVVLQGIFLVVGFAVMTALAENNVV